MVYIKKVIVANIRFIKFCVVGVSNLTISLISYYILIYLNLPYQMANVVSFILGSLNGYYWNKKWVFETQQSDGNAIIKFYATYICTWLLSSILLFIWIEVLLISKYIGPLLNVVITTPINYFLNNKWTFKKSRS